MRVLFLCLGNICRSPAAEGIFIHRARERGVLDRFEVDSAGLGDWHAGERPDPRALNEAARRGIELNFSLEVDAVGSLLDLVREGCGHAVVPQSVVWAGLPGGGVVARRIVRPRLASLLALVTSTRRPATLLSSGTEAILRALLQQAMGDSRGGATAQAAAT